MFSSISKAIFIAYFFFSTLYPSFCFSRPINENKIKEIKAFSEIYGYVRYFHPSDEAATIDWNAFVIYGIQEIFNSQDSLPKMLSSLFKPIAPTVVISNRSITRNNSLHVAFQNPQYKLIYWQHIGVRADANNDIYRSKRTHRKEEKYIYFPIQSNLLFEDSNSIDEHVNKKISESLYCDIPLCLYGDTNKTYPVSDPIKLKELKSNLAKIDQNDTISIFHKLASIIIIDNLIKHFYPYRNKISNWEKLVDETLHLSLDTKTYSEFINLLKSLTSKLNDGHSNIWSSLYKPAFFPPINLTCINDTLIISDVLDTSIKDEISKGDIVLSIDDQDADLKAKSILRITAGSRRYKRYSSTVNILKGVEGSTLKLKIKNKKRIKDFALVRNLSYTSYSQYIVNYPALKTIDNEILYINFLKATVKSLDSLITAKTSYKSIICDVRGYPNSNHSFLSHLLVENDTCEDWMRIPEITQPNFSAVSFEKSGWKLRSLKPYISSQMIFLTDNKAISYSESFMGIVKHYKLGLIVGDTTAGTNGNLNIYKLPSRLNFSWTGMQVTNLKDELIDEVGISPDIRVPYTIQGISNGEDEVLNKAIELSKNYKN